LGYHVGIVRDPTHLSLAFTFDFMKLAFNLILRARFHGVLASPESTFNERPCGSVAGFRPE